MLREAPETDLAKIVDFYDYLEVQPLGNNAFMLQDEEKYGKNQEDLINLNKKIIQLGDRYGENQYVPPVTFTFWIPRTEEYTAGSFWPDRALKTVMNRHLYILGLPKKC